MTRSTCLGRAALIVVLFGLTGCAADGGLQSDAQSAQSNAASTAEGPVVSQGIIRAAAWNRSCVAGAGAVTCQGIDDAEGRSEVEMVEGLPGDAITGLAIGRDFSCALTVGEGAWCWGSNESGELGAAAAPDTAQTAVRAEGLPTSASEIVAGRAHVCVATEADGVWCWGSNAHGQITGSVSEGATLPRQVTPLALSDLTSSGFETCGVATDADGESLVCWGNNRWGQIDAGIAAETLAPTVIAQRLAAAR